MDEKKKKAKQGYELLMTLDGRFYFGRQLRNGSMSADAQEIDEEQMMNAFVAWFDNHCRRHRTDSLWLNLTDGAVLLKRFTAEQMAQAMERQKVSRELPTNSKKAPRRRAPKKG